MYTSNFCRQPQTVTNRTSRMARCNVQKSDASLILKFSFPGFTKDQIDIQIEERMLIVRAKKTETPQPEMQFIYKEFNPLSSNERQIWVPENYNLSDISASMQNGELRIEIQKVPLKVTNIPVI